jgi:hypothetical protein
MDQQPLFHEDINDALRSAVKACGGTKVVASKFWPEKPIADATSYLNDCLNPTRPAKLSPEQVLYLLRWAKDQGFHGAMAYINGEAGYAAPVPIEPEDEYARLQREYIAAVKALQQITPKLETAQAKLRNVA